MTTILDLQQSISTMSKDQLLEHIRTIRSLRRMIPEKAVRKANAKKTTGKKNLSIKNHLETLSENEKQAMIELLLKRKGA